MMGFVVELKNKYYAGVCFQITIFHVVQVFWWSVKFNILEEKGTELKVTILNPLTFIADLFIDWDWLSE